MFRMVNEQIMPLNERFGLDNTSSYVCECRNVSFTKTVDLTPVEYESIRTHEGRFVIALTHENLEDKTVLEQNESFAVVETLAVERAAVA